MSRLKGFKQSGITKEKIGDKHRGKINFDIMKGGIIKKNVRNE